MAHSGKKDGILKYKLLYTALILGVYILGRCIPLYGLDISAYSQETMDAEGLLMQTIGGDAYRTSIFAIGISPYMLSSLFVQIAVLCRNEEKRARTSPGKTARVTLAVTVLWTFLQALSHVEELKFRAAESGMLSVMKIVAILEMTAGVMLILWLADRNKRYGIGGQTALIFVNILDGIFSTLGGHSPGQLLVPLLISAAVVMVIVVMENTEKRIPVQRISIHNIYGDKNYLAVKLNPVGVMPVMFSTAFFMIPQLCVSLLGSLFPENGTVAWWQENMALTRPLGIIVYILCLYVLTVGFSMMFINPKDITEQFLKSGDSIVNLHAGRDTKRYLRGVMCRISLISATVMGICLGVPLGLQLGGGIEGTLGMLPSSVMMLTGIWCNLYREVRVFQSYEAYEPFL